jgi:hypothetical protein
MKLAWLMVYGMTLRAFRESWRGALRHASFLTITKEEAQRLKSGPK